MQKLFFHFIFLKKKIKNANIFFPALFVAKNCKIMLLQLFFFLKKCKNISSIIHSYFSQKHKNANTSFAVFLKKWNMQK